MITQRLLDEWHVAAMDYRDQIRDEFLKGLMGNRQQGAMRPPAPQPQMMNGGNPNSNPPMQQGQMPMDPMMGGQNGATR